MMLNNSEEINYSIINEQVVNPLSIKYKYNYYLKLLFCFFPVLEFLNEALRWCLTGSGGGRLRFRAEVDVTFEVYQNM